jgi:hypothetical protein
LHCQTISPDFIASAPRIANADWDDSHVGLIHLAFIASVLETIVVEKCRGYLQQNVAPIGLQPKSLDQLFDLPNTSTELIFWS